MRSSMQNNFINFGKKFRLRPGVLRQVLYSFVYVRALACVCVCVCAKFATLKWYGDKEFVNFQTYK